MYWQHSFVGHYWGGVPILENPTPKSPVHQWRTSSTWDRRRSYSDSCDSNCSLLIRQFQTRRRLSTQRQKFDSSMDEFCPRHGPQCHVFNLFHLDNGTTSFHGNKFGFGSYGDDEWHPEGFHVSCWWTTLFGGCVHGHWISAIVPIQKIGMQSRAISQSLSMAQYLYPSKGIHSSPGKHSSTVLNIKMTMMNIEICKERVWWTFPFRLIVNPWVDYRLGPMGSNNNGTCSKVGFTRALIGEHCEAEKSLIPSGGLEHNWKSMLDFMIDNKVNDARSCHWKSLSYVHIVDVENGKNDGKWSEFLQ